ncbi:uncharacterized protein BXIN_0677 [Babesia sp. Xinjiang]|uniref:uncharacterized protein n=1 Tax=Babesia sp. Xinjiang TaxID=462227 RepID=UPI000A263FC0|nr:uncharacterized protein BXIN_0722 [Babesia sp. Xinjiang]XP_028872593.1 uncharacterized protein BXIN_0677 [Babesia sp. Xinjiang]ORM42098.1 hypothetical protein BXIN_0722 [Babesia sp. Xinjiang]ORM42137.1 hypothetical protein BXIN_0677 [Babesia sp. Xinjiang]
MGVDRPFNLPRFVSDRKVGTTHISVDHRVPTCGGAESGQLSSYMDLDVNFLSSLPNDWIPHTYVGDVDGSYMRSRHLLLCCITAGLHRADNMIDPQLQVLRITRVPCTASNRHVQHLLNAYVVSGFTEKLTVEPHLLLSCYVDVAGRGSLSVGDRIYLPSRDDLEKNEQFTAAVITGTFGDGSSRWMVPDHERVVLAPRVSSNSRKQVPPLPITEPAHYEYKLCNLKQRFGCVGRRKKVMLLTAEQGLRDLESCWSPPIRQCIGAVTSKGGCDVICFQITPGFANKGMCVVQMGSFLELLRLSIKVCRCTVTSPLPINRLHLFAWLRSTSSRDYVAGWSFIYCFIMS